MPSVLPRYTPRAAAQRKRKISDAVAFAGRHVSPEDLAKYADEDEAEIAAAENVPTEAKRKAALKQAMGRKHSGEA